MYWPHFSRGVASSSCVHDLFSVCMFGLSKKHSCLRSTVCPNTPTNTHTLAHCYLPRETCSPLVSLQRYWASVVLRTCCSTQKLHITVQSLFTCEWELIKPLRKSKYNQWVCDKAPAGFNRGIQPQSEGDDAAEDLMCRRSKWRKRRVMLCISALKEPS